MRILFRTIGTVALMGMLFGMPAGASAHANLVRSDPAEGSVIATAPDRITLTFSERLERAFSSIDIVDRDNKRVAFGEASISQADPRTMSIALGTKTDGAYTVIWQALSAEDGHLTRGAFAFAVGDPATTATPSVQAGAAGLRTSAPTPISVASRWLTFLSPTLLVGAAIFQLFVIGPLLRRPWPNERARALARAHVSRRLRLIVQVAVVGLVVAIPLVLFAQATIATGRDLVNVLQVDVLASVLATRYGQIVLIRAALVALTVFVAAWWLRSTNRKGQLPGTLPTVSLLVAGLAILVTASLVSHASAVPDWTWLAITFDWLHLVAVSVWIGGVVALAFTLGPYLAATSELGRGRSLLRILPRFSVVALASVAVLTLTGLYAMWLHFPNAESLTGTEYGRALLLKLAAFAVLLVIGALNLLFITPALRPVFGRSIASLRDRTARMGRLFRIQVGVEVALGLVALFALAIMIGYPPATSTVTGQYRDSQLTGDIITTLTISPNDLGPNRYVVGLTDRSGRPVYDGSRVVIRFRFLDRNQGEQEAILQPGPNGTWLGEGSHLNAYGNWGIRVITRRTGADDAEGRYSNRLGGPVVRQIRGPFPTPADLGLTNEVLLPIGMIAAGAIVAMLAFRSLRRDPRLAPMVLTAGLAVAIFGSYLLIFQTPRTSASALPVNLVAPTADSIARGREYYLESCAACHGQGGRGDGPLARGLNPKPVDLSQHVEFHPEGQLYQWIAKGVPGTAMPAWESQYNSTEIWDMVNFLRATFTVVEQ